MKPIRGIAADVSCRVAIVTNIPAPYRVPVFNLVASTEDIELAVVYLAGSEADRLWNLPPLRHPHHILKSRTLAYRGRFIHFGTGAWRVLANLDPQVVVTTGYNPPHLVAVLFSILRGRTHIAMTDGSIESEAGLSTLHRIVRRLVVGRSIAGVAASNGGWRLLRHYGMSPERIHFSPLCSNSYLNWGDSVQKVRDLDLLFSGRLVALKNPGFVLDVAAATATRLRRRIKVAFLGAGPLEAELRSRAAVLDDTVDATFAGYQPQEALPRWYGRANLHLFPSLWDPWGVVVNEAAMAGTPTISSPHSGAAGELVRDNYSGRVLPLSVELWASTVEHLLTSPHQLQRLRNGALEAVRPYNAMEAAAGLSDAVRAASRRHSAPSIERSSKFRRQPRVVCVQRRLPLYRVPFFEHLRDGLDRLGIAFVLVHGDPSPLEQSKQDSGHLEWAVRAPCKYLLNERLVWQDPRPATIAADLLILSHENRMLYNVLAMTVDRPDRLAFWGHGRNFQSSAPDGLPERIKRRTLGSADWWFAYTALTTRHLEAQGFDPDRITTVDNAIDTRRLATDCDAVTDAEVARFRLEHALGSGPIALFVGSLYEEKRLDFLLDATRMLRSQMPDLNLVVVGAGPMMGFVRDAASREPWIHPLGALGGKAKAICLKAAAIFVNPGLVGLGILDSFASGVPMVTTACAIHSPEIAYLRDGENGLISSNSVHAYVEACSRLLRDPSLRYRLSVAALGDRGIYTVESMTHSFIDGVLRALELPPRATSRARHRSLQFLMRRNQIESPSD